MGRSTYRRRNRFKYERIVMTHEELLKLIDLHISIGYAQSGFSEYAADGTKCEQALRAVVELHKPIYYPDKPEGPVWCNQCAEGRGYAKYPCPTIQAIEKELG
jgi:hypothetical protein